jgi:hypothetical protein
MADPAVLVCTLRSREFPGSFLQSESLVEDEIGEV